MGQQGRGFTGVLQGASAVLNVAPFGQKALGEKGAGAVVALPAGQVLSSLISRLKIFLKKKRIYSRQEQESRPSD